MAKINLEPGLTIHYEDFNLDGLPAVVLLHGLGANGESWQLQIPPLIDDGYRVIVPDMRGFGRSTCPGGNNNPQIMAQDIINLLEQIGVETYHLIGISLGGTVALQVTLSRPAMIKSLVLTNTFAKLRPRKLSLWIFFGIRLLLVHLIGIETQAGFVAKRLFPNPDQEVLRETFKEQVSQSNPKGYRATMRSLAQFDVSDKVGALRVSTLVVTGERDTVVPPESQVELADLIPGSQQIFIQNAGHAVTIEKPKEYNQVLLDFLNTTERQ